MAKEYATLNKMRELAKKSALLDEKVYVVYRKSNEEYSYVLEGESFVGKLIEYVYPY